MLFSTELLLAACIGAAMAGPTHMHRHRNVHAKRQAVDWSKLDWDNMGINWSSAWAAGQSTKTSDPVATATASPIIAAAKPAVTTSAAAAAVPSSTASSAKSSNTAASVVSDVVSDVKTLFSTIEGMANSLTSFGEATAISGSDYNTIANMGSPQGSNIIKVNSIKGYDYTNTFKNTQSVPITILIWNKAAYYSGQSASTALANLGPSLAFTQPALSFTLAAGAQQSVAFMAQSSIAFSQAVSGKTAAGAPDTTWGEVSFGMPTGNGFDVSSIENSAGNTYNMAMSAAETSCKSDTTQNNWISSNGVATPIGNSDGSCFVQGSAMTLTTSMGGNI